MATGGKAAGGTTVSKKALPLIISLLIVLALGSMSGEEAHTSVDIASLPEYAGMPVEVTGYVCGVADGHITVSDGHDSVIVYTDGLAGLENYDIIKIRGTPFVSWGRTYLELSGPGSLEVTGKKELPGAMISDITSTPELFTDSDMEIYGMVAYPPSPSTFTLTDGASYLTVSFADAAVYEGNYSLMKGSYAAVRGSISYNVEKGRFEMSAVDVSLYGCNIFSATIEELVTAPSLWEGAHAVIDGVIFGKNDNVSFMASTDNSTTIKADFNNSRVPYSALPEGALRVSGMLCYSGSNASYLFEVCDVQRWSEGK